MTRRETIIAILARYRVAKIYRASHFTTGAKYAVFEKGIGPITEPMPHEAAKAEWNQVVADAILLALTPTQGAD